MFGEPVSGILGRLAEIRERLAFVDCRSLPVMAGNDGRVRVWHFAGGLASASLVRALSSPGVASALWGDFSVSMRATSTEPVARAIAKVDPADACPPLPDDITATLKFGACLPTPLASAVLKARTADPDAVAEILSRPLRQVRS